LEGLVLHALRVALPNSHAGQMSTDALISLRGNNPWLAMDFIFAGVQYADCKE
jgi:hypothetical protein